MHSWTKDNFCGVSEADTHHHPLKGRNSTYSLGPKR